MHFCLQTVEIKNKSVECEVYKKPNVKNFTPQDTGGGGVGGKLPRSNDDDLLEVQ